MIQIEKHVSVRFSITSAKFVYSCQIHELGKILPTLRYWQNFAKDVNGCHFILVSVCFNEFHSYVCQSRARLQILYTWQNPAKYMELAGFCQVHKIWQPTLLPYNKIVSVCFPPVPSLRLPKLCKAACFVYLAESCQLHRIGIILPFSKLSSQLYFRTLQ